jgi:hypothetical protein
MERRIPGSLGVDPRYCARPSFGSRSDDVAASETPTRDDDDARRIAEWIDALRAGTNPFTPAVLAALRQR